VLIVATETAKATGGLSCESRIGEGAMPAGTYIRRVTTPLQTGVATLFAWGSPSPDMAINAAFHGAGSWDIHVRASELQIQFSRRHSEFSARSPDSV
jgi:hypothetical protein